MRLTKQSESQPPTLSELRNSLAQIHTAPLRMVRAARYERDMEAALRMVDKLEDDLAASERARRIAERALWLCCQNEVERQIAVNGSCALTVEETRGMWCKAAAMVEASDEREAELIEQISQAGIRYIVDPMRASMERLLETNEEASDE